MVEDLDERLSEFKTQYQEIERQLNDAESLVRRNRQKTEEPQFRDQFRVEPEKTIDFLPIPQLESIGLVMRGFEEAEKRFADIEAVLSKEISLD